jgi:hypothetical protein
MNDQDPSTIEFSKAEMLRRIHEAYTALNSLIQPLNEEELNRTGPEGWAIKDHLLHLAAWEQGIADHLQHQDRYALMGVREAVDQNLGIDEINERIHHSHAHLSAGEAKQRLSAAHLSLLDALEPLSEAQLQLPYSAYLPEGNQPAPETPVWLYVVGNSSGHYEEHIPLISALVDEIGQK